MIQEVLARAAEDLTAALNNFESTRKELTDDELAAFKEVCRKAKEAVQEALDAANGSLDTKSAETVRQIETLLAHSIAALEHKTTESQDAINSTASQATTDITGKVDKAKQDVDAKVQQATTDITGKVDKAKQDIYDKVQQAGQGDSSDVDQSKGLGLTKTVNRIPNMQECQKNEPWAASPNWVFKLLLGEAQEGVKDQISKSLQKRVKEDNAIFCYRGSVPAADINAVTKSGIYSVAYSGSSGCLLVFDTYGSAGVIQFYKAGYSGNIPWKYRNAVDSDTKRWTAWKTFLCQDNFKLSGTTLEITL